jgi:hypothetical protein
VAEDAPIEAVSDDCPERASTLRSRVRTYRPPMVWMPQKLVQGDPLMATIRLRKQRCEFGCVGYGVM